MRHYLFGIQEEENTFHMIKYSIIIPHKNIPQLLQRCIESIPLNSDIEIIIIDDNSNSDTIKQLSKLEKRYPNISWIYTKEGKGAGYARNIGLEQAKGKWIIFADADDFFEKNFIKVLDHHYKDDEDIIYFTTRSVDNNTLQPVENRMNIIPYIQKNKIQKLRYCHYVPWGKMLKQNFIRNNNILFEEVLASNDVFFSVSTGIKAKKINAYNECIYISTVRKDSLFFLDTIEKLNAKITVSKHVNELYRLHGLYLYRYNRFELISKYKKLSFPLFRQELYRFFKEEPILGIFLDIARFYKSRIFSFLKK